MSVVAAYVYRDGTRDRPISLEASGGLDDIAPGEFVWIGLLEPTEHELQVLQARFQLHPLAVEDAHNAHQLPKVDVYGDQLFVVTKTAQLDDEVIVYGETAIFVGRNFIISVRHGSPRAHLQLREHLEAAPSLLKHGADYVLHAILDFIVDGYLPIVDAIEDDGEEMERRAMDAFLTREEIAHIFALRRELTRFRRVLGPMEEVCGRLEHMESPCLDPEVRPYFRDVYDHVRRVQNRVDGLREILSSVFEAANLLEQQRQGAITRKLAAWATIFAIPTAVAGIYGMNFDNMPELRLPYGYHLTLLGIGVICLLLYLRFKREKWL